MRQTLILTAILIIAAPVLISAGVANWSLFHDAFSDFDWNESTTGFFSSNGDELLADNPSAGRDSALTDLGFSITPAEDFVFNTYFRVNGDSTNAAGGVGIALLTDANVMVAKLQWYDNQLATGFGGLDFQAEGSNFIHHSGNSEYPEFEGEIGIERICHTWYAKINGTRIDSLVQQPTLTATKLVILYGYASNGTSYQDFRVDYAVVHGTQRASVCGDLDLSGSIDIADLTYMVNYMFDDGAAPCSKCNK